MTKDWLPYMSTCGNDMPARNMVFYMDISSMNFCLGLGKVPVLTVKIRNLFFLVIANQFGDK